MTGGDERLPRRIHPREQWQTRRAPSEADKAEAVRTGGALFETPTAGGGGGGRKTDESKRGVHSADRPRMSHTSGEVMRALLICGILLFSAVATAQDRSSCFTNCGAIYFTCRHQCPIIGPESTACVQRCVQQINECKKQCNLRYPLPLFPPPRQ